jgi:predicted alpha/beta-hydrolase family hydrolase
MLDSELERDVTFDGATGRLRGRLRPPVGTAWGVVVLCHGRSEDMAGPLVTALARLASEEGLWSVRFNFAFVDAGSEPSGGHADEIADLRAAMDYARTTCGVETIFVAGRGLGAWASVAAATDELCAGAILLGLSYEGQPERRMAIERLEEFEVPTLVIVGFESARTDLPRLRDLVASMTSVNLEIIGGADHRLKDAAGRTMTEAVLMPVEAWLRLRKKQHLA